MAGRMWCGLLMSCWARLAEDGYQFDVPYLFAALAALIGEGRVAQRPAVGVWLNNGSTVSTVEASS